MPRDPIVHLIDDDDAARESLSFLLATAQLPVRCYESAMAFLETAPTDQFGCVITDVRMPKIDGIELLRRLRAHKIDWPVIVVTGHADVPVAVEAMKNGAADFIEKPYDAEIMLSAVRAALASQGRTLLATWKRPASGKGSSPCLPENAKSWTDWSQDALTRRLPMALDLVSVPWKFIALTS